MLSENRKLRIKVRIPDLESDGTTITTACKHRASAAGRLNEHENWNTTAESLVKFRVNEGFSYTPRHLYFQRPQMLLNEFHEIRMIHNGIAYTTSPLYPYRTSRQRLLNSNLMCGLEKTQKSVGNVWCEDRLARLCEKVPAFRLQIVPARPVVDRSLKRLLARAKLPLALCPK